MLFESQAQMKLPNFRLCKFFTVKIDLALASYNISFSLLEDAWLKDVLKSSDSTRVSGERSSGIDGGSRAEL